jgi:Flp pilus assembly protein TadG
MMQTLSKNSKLKLQSRRGAVAVEFAMTAGLVFFFFFAALEFSRVAMIRGTVDNAIYEGARAGIIPGATVDDVENRTNSVLATAMIRNAKVKVSPEPIKVSSKTVRVSVEVPLNGNGFSPAVFFRGRKIERTIQMNREAHRFVTGG